MIHEFTEQNIQNIGRVLKCTPKKLGDDVFRLELVSEEDNRKLALEIHLGLNLEDKRMNMVSVYATSTFMQLHNCTAFIASDMLRQVTFFGKCEQKTSGLIVGSNAGCSFYANVDEAVLTGDFTRLPQDVMMCGVALSLTDSLDGDDFKFDDDPPIS
ncbi:MAG: hypothetical protein EA360_04605 [Balneolaceae bacterium]|nr:MAG: hypothetical protein EA360_04605 [Balneolaceae bacterium]